MKPINKYIIINKIEEETRTASGLLLSSDDVNSFRYHKGRVVKPGTNVTVISEGDEIYYDKGAGHTLLVDNDPYTIIQEHNVVMVL